MGVWKLKLENWPYEFETDLRWFEAIFSSSQVHGGHPRWWVAPPYRGGGTRSSYSRALGLTSPEWCRGSVAADRGSWELQQAKFELRRAGTETAWLEKKARQPLGRTSSSFVSRDSGEFRRYRLVRWEGRCSALRRGVVAGWWSVQRKEVQWRKEETSKGVSGERNGRGERKVMRENNNFFLCNKLVFLCNNINKRNKIK